MDTDQAKEGYQLTAYLRKAGISVDFYPEPAKWKKQFDFAEKRGIPFALLYGEEEMKQGVVQVKELRTGDQEAIRYVDLAAHLATR